MLISGVCLVLTAALAGLTGTWSPCGLSSVDTLGTSLGRESRRGRTVAAVLAFTVAAVAGGALTFGAAAAVGGAAGLGDVTWAALLAAAIALGAGIGDLRFLPIVPQIRRQVPEAVRWQLPLPVTAAFYGGLLGLGFTTYLFTYAMWALLAAALLLGSPLLGVVLGATFGLGRALPVVVLACRFTAPTTQQFIEDMERGPALIGLRRIDGAALLLCALVVAPVAIAGAATRTSVRSGAADPSVAPGLLAYQDPAGGAVLARAGLPPVTLPGTDPAVAEGGTVAWRSGDTVTVADGATLTPAATFAIPGVRELALTPDRLVYRRTEADGRQVVGAQDLSGGAAPSVLFRSRDAIGRPSVAGTTVAFAVAGRRGSRIVAVDLLTRQARTVRRAGLGTQISQAAVHGRRLAYVSTNRCGQELRFGTTARPAAQDRALLRLRPVGSRDSGFQRGYPDAYNAASKCPHRPTSRRAGVLSTVALSGTRAYVTRLPPTGTGAPALLQVHFTG
ncbi:hypothetical protein DSM112329_01845 [Paraconexibacter sp. AEG42_29]|uniref:Uncharacterized protein n=1 Tax=Paraconexibacter sp. AEG42_29 TaxID=2997339 RepID=A0AAU7AUI3_9ACTN